MTKNRLRSLNVACAGLALLAAAGCATKGMSRYNIHVSMDEGLADSAGTLPSVEVHLVGTDRVRGRRLQNMSMTEYWSPARRRDTDGIKVMQFGTGRPSAQALSRNDPYWNRWHAEGASYLFVLADLPGVIEDADDVKDPRRMILPIDRTVWPGVDIRIMIESGGLFCLTPRRRLPGE